MPVGITIVDKERKIRNVNNAAAVMIGQDKGGGILGRVCHEFVCSIYDHEKTVSTPKRRVRRMRASIYLTPVP